MTTNLGELLRRKLEQNEKQDKRDRPLTAVVRADNDGTYVAVVIAERGAWFARHRIEDLMYDPYIVHMVQEKESYMEEDYDREGWTVEQREAWGNAVIEYCRKMYPDIKPYALESVLWLGICWVRVGRRFVVQYEGEESGEHLMFEDVMGWLDAGKRSV